MFKWKKKKQDKQKPEQPSHEEINVTTEDVVRAIDSPYEEIQVETSTTIQNKPQEEVSIEEEPMVQVDTTIKEDEPTEQAEPVEQDKVPQQQMDIAPIVEEAESVEVEEEPKEVPEHFIWANIDMESLSRKEQKQWKKKNKKKAKKTSTTSKQKVAKTSDRELPQKIEEPTQIVAKVDDTVVPKKRDVDLNSFFENASKDRKKLKRHERKKYSKRELKRREKRKKKQTSSNMIKDQNVYLFRKKKYKNVDDFIKYLNDHYLDIDDVAHDVLNDELFFGWISKRSGMFQQSLTKFKKLKEQIEKKT